jgi:hypothetical protein
VPDHPIDPRPLTFPARRDDGTTYHCTVPIDWPATVRHNGQTYRATGKVGHRVSDKMQCAEYEGPFRWAGARVWLMADGTVTED